MIIDPQKYPQPRTRHHTNPQFYLPARELHVMPANYPPLVEACDWSQFFLNAQAPSALDIGCGWGNFLMNYAEAHPNINVLGIETREQPVEWINGVIKGESLTNVHALWYTVANGLKFIADDCIESVFYFFPDPWFKKRHFKRRAFSTGFLDEIRRVLKSDGVLYLMTDVESVDQAQCELLAEHGSFDVQLVENDADWFDTRTDHELHSLRLNIPYVRRRCMLRS